MLLQPVVHLVRAAYAGGVDDAGALLLVEQGGDARQLGVVVDGGVDAEVEIVALGTGVDDPCVRGVEAGKDLLDHLLGGGGGERQHGWVAERFARIADAEIRRPKVVSPLRDAVRLVDDQQRDAAGLA